MRIFNLVKSKRLLSDAEWYACNAFHHELRAAAVDEVRDLYEACLAGLAYAVEPWRRRRNMLRAQWCAEWLAIHDASTDV